MSSEYGTIFKRPKHGDPVSKVCDVDQINAVYSALEDIEGVWCRIERDSKDGKGWRIVIDGGSDIDAIPRTMGQLANNARLPVEGHRSKHRHSRIAGLAVAHGNR